MALVQSAVQSTTHVNTLQTTCTWHADCMHAVCPLLDCLLNLWHHCCVRQWDAEKSGSIFERKPIFIAGSEVRNRYIQHREVNTVHQVENIVNTDLGWRLPPIAGHIKYIGIFICIHKFFVFINCWWMWGKKCLIKGGPTSLKSLQTITL